MTQKMYFKIPQVTRNTLVFMIIICSFVTFYLFYTISAFSAPRRQAAENSGSVLVVSVLPNTIAEKADIRAGDIIVALDNITIDDPKHLVSTVSRIHEGTHSITIIRNERIKHLSVNFPKAGRNSPLGIRVIPYTPQTSSTRNSKNLSSPPKTRVEGEKKRSISRRSRAANKGSIELTDKQNNRGTILVQSVNPGSAAAKAGLKVKDTIVEAGGQDFSDPHKFADYIKSLGEGPLDILLVRDGIAQIISVDLPPKNVSPRLGISQSSWVSIKQSERASNSVLSKSLDKELKAATRRIEYLPWRRIIKKR